jgi:antitoxin YobK
MSMADYEQAKVLIEANRAKGQFVGPRTEELVQLAETTLKANFPPTYRRFLLEFGAGNFGSAEFYGIIDDDFENSSVPDGVWFTQTERQDANLPANLMVIGDTGTGDLYCLELRLDGGEGRVVVLDPGGNPSMREEIAPDFGSFFLARVRQQLQREFVGR